MQKSALLNLAQQSPNLQTTTRQNNNLQNTAMQNRARQNASPQNRDLQTTLVNVYLELIICEATAQLGLCNFKKTLELTSSVINILSQHQNIALELEVNSILGQFFTKLKDYEKGVQFHQNADSLAKSFHLLDTNLYYERISLSNLVIPYLQQGKIGEALNNCHVSIMLSITVRKLSNFIGLAGLMLHATESWYCCRIVCRFVNGSRMKQ